MTLTTTMLGHTMIESDTFLEPTKYKIRYQCDLCGHNYTRTYKVIPKVDPACPSKACQTKQQLAAMKKEMENLKRMVEAGAAPAQTGGNVRVQAVDETAKIVMEDYQMSDLRDGIRPGESVAPKLPPRSRQPLIITSATRACKGPELARNRPKCWAVGLCRGRLGTRRLRRTKCCPQMCATGKARCA
jgi:hypothetical protein